jgi:membrane associated rhomboid family serine protease
VALTGAEGTRMGMYNRDWYKANASGRWSDWGVYDLTPVVKYLIIANVAVLILQFVTFYEVHVPPLERLRKADPWIDKLLKENGDDPETVERLAKQHPRLRRALENLDYLEDMPGQRVSRVVEWCALDTDKVLHGQVWRLITHAFCHSEGVWHIFFNMLFLYWFGCTLEAMYGSREFLLFYLTAAMFAGLAFMGLDLATGSRIPGIGASGAVMAVTMLYAYYFPRETIYVFWLIRVEMRWLMVFYVLIDLHPVLLALSVGNRFGDGVAHSAHLGGLVFGFLYGWYQWRLEPLISWLPKSSRGLRPQARPRLRVVRDEPQPLEPPPPPDPEMERVDEILRKIADTGQASLTDEERDLLRRASERMKSRRERS